MRSYDLVLLKWPCAVMHKLRSSAAVAAYITRFLNHHCHRPLHTSWTFLHHGHHDLVFLLILHDHLSHHQVPHHWSGLKFLAVYRVRHVGWRLRAWIEAWRSMSGSKKGVMKKSKVCVETYFEWKIMYIYLEN